MNWYIGPWTWNAQRSSWNPPNGFAAIDLRPIHQQAIAGGMPGIGLFFGRCRLGSDYRLIGTGDWKEIKPKSGLLPVRKGYAVKGDTLRGQLLDMMTHGSDPEGYDACKPLVPTTERIIELACGQCSTVSFKWGLRHTNHIRSMLQQEFSDLMERANRGETSDTQIHRRVLDYWCKKYRHFEWRDFVPKRLISHVAGPLLHATTFTENFNGTDSTTVMGHQLTWTAAASTFGNYNNTGYKVSGIGTYDGCRADHDLSSADHYSQITLANPSGATSNNSITFNGPAARFNSSANTSYHTSNYSNQQYVTKIVAGVSTNLANASSTFGSTDTYKVEANGSTIKGYVNGVEVVSVTDTAITGNTRCGVNTPTTNICWDSFECSDLSVGGVSNQMYFYRQVAGLTI